jgi:hypothetical protein
MIARMCLSDLHLGDSRSVLSSPSTVESVVRRLASLAGGPVGGRPEVDTLVLNGDIWEECVPSDMGEVVGIYQKSVVEASARFFGSLLDAVDVRRVVWIPGNHDLSLWRLYNDLMTSRHGGLEAARRSLTSPEGKVVDTPSLNGWDSLFAPLFGGRPIQVFSVAYPTHVATPWAGGFPHIVFTHGHLLDRLVRGHGSDAAYLGLGVLGCSRPRIPVDAREVGSVRDLAERTDPFTVALWQRYSVRDYVYANQIMRRLDDSTSCPLQRWNDEDVLLATPSSDPSSPRDGLMAEVPWFLDVVVTDPAFPTPVGELRPHNDGPTFTRPSCLVYGHDHLGSQRVVTSSGVPYHVVDSGGWTSEHDGHHPHSHVLVWEDPGQVVPDSYLLRTRLGEDPRG